jgi:hypothetical protein
LSCATNTLTDHVCRCSVCRSAPQTQDRLRNIFLGFVAFFLLVGVVNLMAPLDYAGKKLLW